jgi:hypothetical protein
MGSLYRSKHELFWIAKKGSASHTNNVNLGKDVSRIVLALPTESASHQTDSSAKHNSLI